MELQQHIAKARKNRRPSQEWIYQKFKAYWFTICLRYQFEKEDAEDALQNALIKIFSELKKFDPKKGAFKSWTARIVANENLMLLRKNRTSGFSESINEDLHLIHSDSNPLESLNAKELVELIQRLPIGYRTVFNMYVFEGFSHEEIAKDLGISTGTSKSQLFKARKMLQQKLEVLI